MYMYVHCTWSLIVNDEGYINKMIDIIRETEECQYTGNKKHTCSCY